ncbi:hypothetical protein CTAYLR_006464 [Chrysophaeum taylorii]|uniref:PPPDE domain-containing protein n=1 Tax=Chrysophaeum taylorii TaxID=2483200 RepID=A0AAD7UKT8_9STRA|nr:hypothetical protein CTAYLR_006464 [Chrysophaeum taylorii]
MTTWPKNHGGPRQPLSSHLLVTLNVYDFVKQSDSYSQSLMSFFGLGIHHSGLQIEEMEYTFNSSGIIRMPGLRMPFCRLNESISLGKYWGSKEDIEIILDELADEFRPGSYNIINRNCNHFVETLAYRLIGVSIPSWVNRSANVASSLGLSAKNLRKNTSSQADLDKLAGPSRACSEPPPKGTLPPVDDEDQNSDSMPRVDSMVLI